MKTTTSTLTFALVAAFVFAAGCTTRIRDEPIATRPSLTIYPIQMAGEPRQDVAATVALLLEQRGMESIEVDEAVFAPETDAPFDDQAAAFAAFVAERDLSTEYALYGAVVGSPRRGVDEIQAVLVDGGGAVAWSERQTRDSSAMKRAKPSDPMSCTVFLVERLRDPLDLLRPARGDAPGGRWADYWRSDSLAPTDEELELMRGRLERLPDADPAATVLVYPARAGDSWSVESAERLADAINRRGLLDASVAESPLEFEVQPARNQQRVLWSGARSVQQLVRANPPATDYVLVADYMMSGRTGESMGVHTFLLEADGDWVVVDFQNSHHEDFNAVRPRSLDDCCDLSIVRLERRLGR